MTNQQLFRRFYRACRIDALIGMVDKELRNSITKDARDVGFDDLLILQISVAAINARINTMLTVREPSKQSVAIQLSVHTFGRATKGVA